MTHAWLVTGPPGSGRSVLARAFAAALQCRQQPPGCGQCTACRTALAGSHPDVELVSTEALALKVDRVRELVRRAALRPAEGRWQVIVVEDADRLTEEAADALLLSVEEPPPRTVWVLCAPASADIPPTIRSRCRVVALRTPPVADVAAFLVSEGVDPAMAAFAARAAQGHIGRARALATDEQARLRRQEVLRIPGRLRDLPSCLAAAADLLDAASDDAKAITDPMDVREEGELLRAYGEGADGVTSARIKRLASSALKELQRTQKSRRTRAVRDQLDRALVDLIAYYRDVLVLQTGSPVSLVNEELRPALESEAATSDVVRTGRRLEAVSRARLALQANVAPLLALEALTVELKDPDLRP
jgi:DNA polymerase-3 subunit delta'